MSSKLVLKYVLCLLLISEIAATAYARDTVNDESQIEAHESKSQNQPTTAVKSTGEKLKQIYNSSIEFLTSYRKYLQAQSYGPSGVREYIEERQIPIEEAAPPSEEFPVNDKVIDEEVAIRDVADSKFDLVFITKNGTTYNLKGAPYTVSAENEYYNKLSTAERAKFLKIRAKRLQRLIFITHYSKLAIGTAVITGGKLKQMYNTSREFISSYKEYLKVQSQGSKEIQEYIEQLQHPIELMAVDIESQTKVLPTERKNYYQRLKDYSQKLKGQSHEIVQSMIEANDRAIWRSPKLTVYENEYTLVLGVMRVHLFGVGHKVSGQGYGYAVSVGYNKTTKSVVFQTIMISEKLVSALPFATVIGVTPKIGFYKNSQHPGEEVREFKGKSFYPIGLPAYYDTYEGMYGFGTNWSPPGLVNPPIIADLSSYHTSNSFRITHRAAPSPQKIVKVILTPYRWAVDIKNDFKAVQFEPIQAEDYCRAMMSSRF